MPGNAELIRLMPEIAGRLKSDAFMSAYTTFRIGGPADLLFEPVNDREIVEAMRFCRQADLPVTIIGNGSNILVSDNGIRGLVILLGDRMSGIERHEDLLLVQAGTRLSAAAAYAAHHGLSGMEFASGIPGTLGGAVLMNAGAYEHCMSEIVVLTEYLDQNLELQALMQQEHEFGYRKSYFIENPCVIIRSCLKLHKDNPENIYCRMSELANRRRLSQPLDLPSAGSAFKRPEGHYAGKLISDCGLKGYAVGDAQVSEKHAGFIVNRGNASAAEVRELFRLVQRRVLEQTGVFLEPEVRFIGEW